MESSRVVGLSVVAGVSVLLAAAGGAVAQQAAAPLAPAHPLADLFDLRSIPDSVDGDVPVVSRVLSGAEFASVPGGLRGCAPWTDVGTSPEGDATTGAAFGPDGTWFVVASRQSQNLLVYASDTRTLIREIPLSGSPSDLAVSPDGRWAVTPNLFEDTASIVDLDAGLEVAVLPMGQGPIVARITPDSSTALVGSLVGDDLAVIDLATATELRRIGGLNFSIVLSANFETFATVFACANPIEMAGNGTAVFPDMFNDRIGFVDVAAGTVNFVATADSPRNVAVTPDGTTAIVSHAYGSSNTLGVIDIATESIVDSIAIGAGLTGPVSINPDGTKAVVSVSNAVRVVDLGTGAVGSNLNTASVNQLFTTGDGLHALCVGFRGSLISYATGTLVKDLNNVVSCSVGAVSPADDRGVMFATTFGEDMVVVNTDGAAGFLEEVRPSGPAPEGDKPRTVAVTPDGQTVVTANQYSRNIGVFDASSGSLLGYADTGARPGQVRITPDGTKAVVTNRDSSFVSVIDLGSLVADEVTISTRGDQMRLSPDGTYAYIAVVTNDGVWRVNLDTLTVEGAKLPVGEMGGAGYTGNQFSGIALSNDGRTLVACNSFDDTITVIDTQAWAVVATVGVGDFPTAAVFSPDDARIYVTNRSDETVSVVSNAGGGSAEIGTIGVGAYPYRAVPNADGSKLYVMNTSDDSISVIDTGSMSVASTIAVSETPVGILFDAAGGRVLVAIGTASASSTGELTQAGELAIIDAATDTVVETVCADHFLSDLAADAGFTIAAAAGLGGDSVVFFDIDDCRVDINGDGSVNTQDVLRFLNLWVAEDEAADWDGSGGVDTRDFLAFLNEWVVGC